MSSKYRRAYGPEEASAATPPPKPAPTFAQLEAKHEYDAIHEARRAGIGDRVKGTIRKQDGDRLIIQFVFDRGTVTWSSDAPKNLDVSRGEANG